MIFLGVFEMSLARDNNYILYLFISCNIQRRGMGILLTTAMVELP